MGENNFTTFDIQFALVQVDGDRDLLRKVVGIYSEVYPKQLQELRESMVRNDAETFERVAHTVKGSVMNFGAKQATAAALRLEDIGRSRDLRGSDAALAELEAELKRLEDELKKA